jgi:hypothetical protein
MNTAASAWMVTRSVGMSAGSSPVGRIVLPLPEQTRGLPQDAGPHHATIGRDALTGEPVRFRHAATQLTSIGW